MSDSHPDIHYSESLEEVLKQNGEQFLCLSKAHDSAARFCANWNTRLTIPTIILSGLSGLGAVGSESLLPFPNSTTLVGLVSFICATLQTISSYFAFAARGANHKNASIQYAKLHNLLCLELSLPRSERIPAEKLLMLIKDESARLLESAQQLPAATVAQFKLENKSATVSIPPLLNGLEKIIVNTNTNPPPSTPLTQPERPVVRIVI